MLARLTRLYAISFLISPQAHADVLPLPANLIAASSPEALALLVGAEPR